MVEDGGVLKVAGAMAGGKKKKKKKKKKKGVAVRCSGLLFRPGTIGPKHCTPPAPPVCCFILGHHHTHRRRTRAG
eukprot:SAG22_NODE_3564_length_1640_cov_1.006489_3_plen_75_part_00